MELIVKGAEDLERIGKALKEVGDKQLRRDLLKAIRDATKPTREEVRQSALANLPKRGGLADQIAASKLSTRTRLSGRRVGVRIEARNAHDIRSLDRGRLRHPLFGNRDHWFQQFVLKGWFSSPLLASGKSVRVALEGEMARVAYKYLK